MHFANIGLESLDIDYLLDQLPHLVELDISNNNLTNDLVMNGNYYYKNRVIHIVNFGNYFKPNDDPDPGLIKHCIINPIFTSIMESLNYLVENPALLLSVLASGNLYYMMLNFDIIILNNIA